MTAIKKLQTVISLQIIKREINVPEVDRYKGLSVLLRSHYRNYSEHKGLALRNSELSNFF